MNFKMAIGAAVSSIMMASAAAAATLSISGGDYGALPGNHNPDYSGLGAYAPVPTIGAGDTVARFGDGFASVIAGNGLTISSKSNVKITFLGTEAGATNTALNLAGGVLNNKTSSKGDRIYADDLPTFIDFAFATIKGGGVETITNGVGQTDPDLSIAFYLEDSENALAFFGDGRGDSDFDDMVVRISVVPLPAGGVLLLTALGGMAVARRRKKAA